MNNQHARYMQLMKRNPTRLVINKMGRGETETMDYNHVATLAFNSKVRPVYPSVELSQPVAVQRKRVSVIYEREGRVEIMTKGADSAILPLIHRTVRFRRLHDCLLTSSSSRNSKPTKAC